LKAIRSLESEGSPRITMSVLAKMPGVLVKLAELAGAGLASAAGAYLFAQIGKPTPPPAPIVQIEPVQAELVKAMRSENAALIEELRKAETAKDAPPEAAPARIATAAAPKTTKTSPPPGASHKPAAERGGMAAERKGERVYEADVIKTPPMDERTPSAAAAPLVLGPSIDPAPPRVDSTGPMDRSPAGEPKFLWLARLRRISDIFRPAPSASAPSVVPRPPLPVGDFVQGTM
jgi:hypothetical protein